MLTQVHLFLILLVPALRRLSIVAKVFALMGGIYQQGKNSTMRLHEMPAQALAVGLPLLDGKVFCREPSMAQVK
jgi:hypothetical protein